MTLQERLDRLEARGAVIRASAKDGQFLIRGRLYAQNTTAFGRYDTVEDAVAAAEAFLKEHTP